MLNFFYKQNKLLIYSYSLFIIIFLAFSIFFYFNEKKNENLRNQQYLQTLAKIKSTEITRWYSERYSDASFLFSNAQLRENLFKFLNSASKADSIKSINFINQIYKNHDYKNIFIVDKNYKNIINLNTASDTKYNTDSIVSAVNHDRIVFSNFYKRSY